MRPFWECVKSGTPFRVRHNKQERPVAVSIPVDQLGSALRKRREEAGLSLREVEGQTGISPSTLSRVERGHIPEIALIARIADWLGVTISAGGDLPDGIKTDEDLVSAIEVHLRANKNLDESTARAIARSYEVVMQVELERAKRRGE